jgi:hypothetical protein
MHALVEQASSVSSTGAKTQRLVVRAPLRGQELTGGGKVGADAIHNEPVESCSGTKPKLCRIRRGI